MKSTGQPLVDLNLDLDPCCSFNLPMDIIQKGFDRTDIMEFIRIATKALVPFIDSSTANSYVKRDPVELLEEIRKIQKLSTDPLTAHDYSNTVKVLIDVVLASGIRTYSPRFIGRQYSGTFPLAGIMEWVMAVANQPSSFYEAAPVPNVAERFIRDELIKLVGYQDGARAGMITTSGGSLANLTAILSARSVRYPGLWKDGFLPEALHGRIPAVAMSEESHYSLRRAIGILGIGENQIVDLPVEGKNGTIIIGKVEAALDRAKSAGLDVFCLVASAGTTSRGSIDSLDLLAGISQKRDIWFHIDGSHGASLLLSPSNRMKLKGIQNSDSFCWDLHKMLRLPSPSSLLFYKNLERAKGTFSQKASYVFDLKDSADGFETAEFNFECTKRPMIVPFWTVWTVYGPEIFCQSVDYACSLTFDAYSYLSRQEDFEVCNNPQTNILCFRYKPLGLLPGLVSEFQKRLRTSILREGKFFISKVDIQGATALRVVFLNHQTNFSDFVDLVKLLRIKGSKILSGNPDTYGKQK
jgi:L-2,4-diaminobutyrate decarboxylase